MATQIQKIIQTGNRDREVWIDGIPKKCTNNHDMMIVEENLEQWWYCSECSATETFNINEVQLL